ncbi:MAG: hypothetical protein ABUM51_10790, partial [Bacteroidota bacterium]
ISALIPKWTASPPESFQLFKRKYGIDLKTFWIWAHSIHEITFILAIVFCWKDPFTRNWLITLFLAHFTDRVWTLLYFDLLSRSTLKINNLKNFIKKSHSVVTLLQPASTN